jgi:ribonuclease Y
MTDPIATNDLLAQTQALAKREGALEEREKLLAKKEAEATKKLAELEELRKKAITELNRLTRLSLDEAKSLLLEKLAKDLGAEIAQKIQEAENQIREQAEEKAREILIEAMKHGVVDWTAEYTISTIRLADEESKGRIIGKEGRNIRAFEQATGVEVELDETLDLRLSSFDPVRREIARLSLEKLIKDGRIQPNRIEEVVNQTKAQMEQILFEEGRRLCASVGVYNLQPELVKMLGRYKFRFSYGQNLAQHTLEETKIGLALAAELRADIAVIRLGCLLHDIGKVVTSEEGSHIQLGVDLLTKYRLPPQVIACVAEHHEDKPFSSLESAVVFLADAISGSRPGARYEPHEEYLQRMTHIEEVVKSFSEVAEVAAYQAGREVRVIVKPELVSDDQLTILAHKISQKLEEDAKWAGQIKVTVIRETRASGTAPSVA